VIQGKYQTAAASCFAGRRSRRNHRKRRRRVTDLKVGDRVVASCSTMAHAKRSRAASSIVEIPDNLVSIAPPDIIIYGTRCMRWRTAPA
jgi:hypothetical protein